MQHPPLKDRRQPTFMCFNLRTRDIKGNSFVSDDIYTSKLQTYFTRNIFKVSSVCILIGVVV